MKKNVIIKTFVLALGLSLIAISAYALDYPHTNYPSGVNTIDCGDCHFTHGTAPWDTPPTNIDETFYNNLCWTCHEGVIATDVGTHSCIEMTGNTDCTGSTYGDWTIQCWECHDAHVHEQPDAYGATSYLDSGTSEPITDLNQITKSGAGWTTDQFAGMMVIPDTSNDYYIYEILSNTADTLTVNGPMNLTLGNTYDFAIFYGRLVRSTIDAPDISTCSVVANEFICTTYTLMTARFFRNTGTKSFADGDATYDGVCEVCHTQTTYHKDDGTGASHNAGVNCITCHTHLVGFKGAGACLDCHNTTQGARRQIVGGTSGSAGDDFIRPSRHVSDGTTNEIVTNFDCILCHSEGDNTSSGTTIGTTSVHEDTKVSLRNIDSSANPGTLDSDYWQWPGSGTATSTDRDNMDSFCMSCHDSGGAAGIVVNKNSPADGMNTSPSAAEALDPFNVDDNFRNYYDVNNLGTYRTTTYGRVLDVKSQFNSGDLVGKLWASHHNLNQFTKRYTSRNTTAWPDAAWTTYTTKEGQNIRTAGETAGLHCSDCHLNESNAHGTRNTRYMLSDSSGSDATFTNSGLNNSTDICVKCHNKVTYSKDGSDTSERVEAHGPSGRCNQYPSTDSNSNSASYLSGECDGSAPDDPDCSSRPQLTCLTCHGGIGLGDIHGTNDTYDSGDNGTNTTPRYRFMSGATMRYYSPDKANDPADSDWELGSGNQAGCYTVSAADTWTGGSCTQHGGFKGADISRSRSLEY